jgi:hypothetical protein
MNKELSGAAGDVLHALFFRGALVDGDLPSKAGAAELRELGYVMTQDTVTPFVVSIISTFSPAGQEFAISYLVESRFGKKADFQIGAGRRSLITPLYKALYTHCRQRPVPDGTTIRGCMRKN